MIKYDLTANGFLESRNEIYSLIKGVKNIYENFDKWFEKICDEILLKRGRYSVVAINNNTKEVVGVSIIKKDKEDLKICTIKVKEGYRDLGVGTNIMECSLSFFDKDDIPYITIPGDTDETFNTCNFVTKFGFVLEGISELNNSNHELLFNKKGNQKSIILSIKQFWADRIQLGQKLVEFRRKVIPNDISYVFVNNTDTNNPVISGYFKVKEVIKDTPKNLWEKFNNVGCISEENYFNYFKDRSLGYAIIINNYYNLNISPKKLFGETFKSPQYFKYL